MSLSQRLKDEEKRKEDEARAREKRLEELLRTHPVKLQSKELIPIVGSFLKEMTKSLNLILESEPAPRDNPYYLHNYNVYTKDPNSWFIFPKKGFLLFSIVSRDDCRKGKPDNEGMESGKCVPDRNTPPRLASGGNPFA